MPMAKNPINSWLKRQLCLRDQLTWLSRTTLRALTRVSVVKIGVTVATRARDVWHNVVKVDVATKAKISARRLRRSKKARIMERTLHSAVSVATIIITVNVSVANVGMWKTDVIMVVIAIIGNAASETIIAKVGVMSVMNAAITAMHLATRK